MWLIKTIGDEYQIEQIKVFRKVIFTIMTYEDC